MDIITDIPTVISPPISYAGHFPMMNVSEVGNRTANWASWLNAAVSASEQSSYYCDLQ